MEAAGRPSPPMFRSFSRWGRFRTLAGIYCRQAFIVCPDSRWTVPVHACPLEPGQACRLGAAPAETRFQSGILPTRTPLDFMSETSKSGLIYECSWNADSGPTSRCGNESLSVIALFFRRPHTCCFEANAWFPEIKKPPCFELASYRCIHESVSADRIRRGCY
jgi:hypothetical protein